MTNTYLSQQPGLEFVADWEAAGGVYLAPERLENTLLLGYQAAPFAGEVLEVHVPSVPYRGAWRPGIVTGDADRLPYTLNVLGRRDGSVSVTLGALAGYTLGRPILGYTREKGPSSCFGDPASRTRGLRGIDAHVHPDGTAVLVGDKDHGQKEILKGVKPNELSAFMAACLSVFAAKHRKLRQTASQ